MEGKPPITEMPATLLCTNKLWSPLAWKDCSNVEASCCHEEFVAFILGRPLIWGGACTPIANLGVLAWNTWINGGTSRAFPSLALLGARLTRNCTLTCIHCYVWGWIFAKFFQHSCQFLNRWFDVTQPRFDILWFPQWKFPNCWLPQWHCDARLFFSQKWERVPILIIRLPEPDLDCNNDSYTRKGKIGMFSPMPKPYVAKDVPFFSTFDKVGSTSSFFLKPMRHIFPSPVDRTTLDFPVISRLVFKWATCGVQAEALQRKLANRDQNVLALCCKIAREHAVACQTQFR